MRNIFGKGRYATVASTLALVLALSGTAYAAATVTSADIVDNTIRTADIRNGAVESLDIHNSTVTSNDIADFSIAPVDVNAASWGSSVRLYAQVGSAGTAGLNSGLVSASRTGTGTYQLTWNQSVGPCVVMVTPYGSAPKDVSYSGIGSTINVHIFNAAAAPVDSDFDIAAFC